MSTPVFHRHAVRWGCPLSLCLLAVMQSPEAAAQPPPVVAEAPATPRPSSSLAVESPASEAPLPETPSLESRSAPELIGEQPSATGKSPLVPVVPEEAVSGESVTLKPVAESVDTYPFPEGEERVTADRPLNNDKSRFRLGKGLEFRSQDGDFSMVPRVRAQFLYTWDKSDGDDGKLADATQSFMLRRARLQFGGNFWGEHNRYKFELAVSPRDLGTRDTLNSRAPNTGPLLDWYVDFTQLRDLNLRVGQYKVPFNRQRVISSGDLQFVDRSIVNSAFNVDRDLGLDFRSEDFLGLGLLKYYLGVFVGEGRNTVHQADFGMMYLARVEVLPLGLDGFKDYKESSLERPSSPKLSVGLGYGYLDGATWERGILGSVPADGGTTDLALLNLDAMLKYQGLSFFTEGVLRSGTRHIGDATDDGGEPVAEAPPLDGYGIMAQVGYLFPRTRFELAARLGVVRASDEESGLEDEDELGFSGSYYFAHHAFKLQSDYFIYREGPPSASSKAKATAHQVRVQLQASY